MVAVTGAAGTLAKLNTTLVSSASSASKLSFTVHDGSSVDSPALTLEGSATGGMLTDIDSVVVGTSVTIGKVTLTQSTVGRIDAVTGGVASASKALVVDANCSIANLNEVGAMKLTGEIQTPRQPLITKLGALESLTVNGDLECNGNLVVGGTIISESEIVHLDGAKSGLAEALKAVITDSDNNVAGLNEIAAMKITGEVQTGSQPLIRHLGVLDSLSVAGDVTVGATVISEVDIAKLDEVTNGSAAANKALVLDASLNVSGIHALSATELTGTLTMASQPFMSSVSILDVTNHNAGSTGLKLGGVLVTASADELNFVDTIPGSAEASKALVLNTDCDIENIRKLRAEELTGTLVTAAQPHVSSVSVLNVTAHNGADAGLKLGDVLVTSTANELNYVDTTPGAAQASKALVVDESRNIENVHALTAVELTGVLQSRDQPHVQSVGVLDSLAVTGDVTVGTTVISEADIKKIDAVANGIASMNKALVVDASMNIAGVGAIGATKLAIGAPANNKLPVEIGYVPYTFTGSYAYGNDANAHGLTEAGQGTLANYSLRADGRILVTGEVEVTSDRRLKMNIADINPGFARKFVKTTTPVKFNWRSGDTMPDYGYIAQDVLKLGFSDFVSVAESPGLDESIDEDGFVNPANAKFVFSPGKVVPLLALNQRGIFYELQEKDDKIKHLESIIKSQTDKLKELEHEFTLHGSRLDALEELMRA
ncbi:hypothetical protein PHYBOEH_010667 [Phytophthora boehmeriae]|uniref:Peptidase S74 domain-containing protein n=1 Tax=Phytophthora boehmeriae TaxID=109152 RepID=A0A8T1VRI6_9STRA|nr:hypothetical protein PHYBOEH_010667 [Phytophthora boehmeriae]